MRPLDAPTLGSVPCVARPSQGTAQRRASFLATAAAETPLDGPKLGCPGQAGCRGRSLPPGCGAGPVPHVVRPSWGVEGGGTPLSPALGFGRAASGREYAGEDTRHALAKTSGTPSPPVPHANPQGLHKCALLPAGRRVGAHPPCRSMRSGQALPSPEPMKVNNSISRHLTSSAPSSVSGREQADPSLPPPARHRRRSRSSAGWGA